MNGKRTPAREGRTAPIDWEEIHRRVEAVRAALDEGRMPSLEEKKRILRGRARALSREPEAERSPSGDIEIVEFLLAYERYGLESCWIHEVYPLKGLTPLPGTPPFVLGITNIRGQILSVIDLKKLFGLPEKGLTDLNQVIILHHDPMEFGLLADAILGVRSIAREEIQPSLPTLMGIREEYLKGVTGERVVILDAERLLSDKKMIIHDED
ncbi:MAG: purine-binding chemotaxis protein CheW [Candidatus Tectomicrobia bacterium]|uniref:Purine-binding chemotaxis protein CheW n=1 Tax=Tectimicrobiota bacterium TaxID=2528274 RepID=A0A932CP38_UNCTE|nr:purine-binding chemotaxis protein CheW [Candidatus Tectomicrobia bacterium]